MEFPKVSGSTVVSVIVAVIVLVVLYMLWQKWMPAKPAGALTQAEYDALPADQKALYTKDSNGYYVKA